MQVRTQTLVKGAIVQIAADPFAQVRHPPRLATVALCRPVPASPPPRARTFDGENQCAGSSRKLGNWLEELTSPPVVCACSSTLSTTA